MSGHECVQEQECVQREPAVRAALSEMYRSGKNTGVLHDMKCTGAMHPLSSDVIKVTNLTHYMYMT